MVRLNPYIAFDGTCKDAMTFYQECLGGELWMQTVGESPAAASFPAESHGKILHSQLESGSMVLMAADIFDGTAPNAGNTMTVSINSGTRDETRGYFEKLAAGGTITSPLTDEFFGMFGTLTDKFGVNWSFQAE